MRKRYKLLLIIIISIILVFISYYIFHKDKYIYLAIGDNLASSIEYSYIDYLNNDLKYENYYLTTDYITINHLLTNIENNDNNILYYLKNANIITIALGTMELYNYEILSNEIYIDYLNDLYMLLTKIRELNNNKIYLINLYNDNYNKVNIKIDKYIKEFKIEYIDFKTLENYTYILNNRAYLSAKGHKKIYNIIKRSIDK